VDLVEIEGALTGMHHNDIVAAAPGGGGEVHVLKRSDVAAFGRRLFPFSLNIRRVAEKAVRLFIMMIGSPF